MHTIIYNCFAEKALLKKRKRHSRIAFFIIIFLSSFIFFFFFLRKTFSAGAVPVKVISPIAAEKIVQIFNQETLKKYDGTDPSLPIYLALDGEVYDISRGRKLYGAGGEYHYLAGIDSSGVLHVLGVDIIKSKYPVIGRYVNM